MDIISIRINFMKVSMNTIFLVFKGDALGPDANGLLRLSLVRAYDLAICLEVYLFFVSGEHAAGKGGEWRRNFFEFFQSIEKAFFRFFKS